MIRVLSLLPFLLLASCRPNKLSSSHHPGLHDQHDHHDQHNLLHNQHNVHDHHHHDEDVLASQTVESYLSPSAFGEREAAASQAVDSYLPPLEYEYDEEPAASQAVDSYLIPEQEPAASRAVESYLGPAPEVLPLASQVVDNYLVLPELEPAASQAVDSYLIPEQEVEPAASRAVDSYLVPFEDVAASSAVDSYLLPEQEPAASSAVDSYLLPEEDVAATRTLESYFGSSDREAAPSQTRTYYSLPTSQVLEPQASVVRTVAVTRAPIAIIREVNTGPQDGNYDWSFETENGISQSVEGRMKMVDDSPVYVMQGEYSYPGADGNMWKVEWYADETGYHPSAPFLPKNVVPTNPEVLAAVNAQLEAAASVTNQVFALPESRSLAGYGGQQEELEGYGQQDLEGYGQQDLEGYGEDGSYGTDLQGYAKL